MAGAKRAETTNARAVQPSDFEVFRSSLLVAAKADPSPTKWRFSSRGGARSENPPAEGESAANDSTSPTKNWFADPTRPDRNLAASDRL
jgi:hypothetical protein